MKMLFEQLGILALIASVACGGGGDPNPITQGDDDEQVTDPNNGLKAPAPWSNVTFTTQDVEVKNGSAPAGDHGTMVRGADGTLYYLYYRATANRTCNIALFGGGPAPSFAFDLAVAVKAPGASTFTIETVPLGSVTGAAGARGALDYVSNPYGIDAGVTDTGLVFAVPAGGDGQFVCASSDLVLGRRTGANTYSLNAIVTGSAAGGAPSPSGGDETCPSGGACDQGTDVGAWAAVAVRSNGSLAVAYSDLHFATDDDGLTDSDFELWQEGGGVTGIRQWSGAGRWAKMREINGRLVAAYSTYSAGASAYVLTLGDNGKWTGSEQSGGSKVGERLALEVAPNGTVGFAYYAIEDNNERKVDDLYLCESTDNGVTFPVCSKPELPAIVAGANPSLAYDSQSRPVLSYYYCGSGTCVNDGLRVAWRDNTGKWWKYNIANVAQNRAGFYSSIVLDPTTDEPTVAFQDLTRGAAMVAYGRF